MSDWIYIDDCKLDSSNSIHCDTRDFHILNLDLSRSEYRRVIKGIRKSAGSGTLSDCKFNQSEIIPLLKLLEEDSGGKAEWRMISNKLHKDWLKYIRFIKVDNVVSEDPVYIAYENSGEVFNVLSRNVLMSEINKEYLSVQ